VGDSIDRNANLLTIVLVSALAGLGSWMKRR
jgi:hypothetical protein